MKRIISLFFLFLLFSHICLAQTDTKEAIKEINAIKSNPKYLYAESTNADWNQAYDNARLILSSTIEDWVKSQGNSDVSGIITKAENKSLQIQTRRGQLYRAFVYVNKSDLLSFNEDNAVMMVNIKKNDDSSKEAKDQTEVVYAGSEKPEIEVPAAKVEYPSSDKASLGKNEKEETIVVDQSNFVKSQNTELILTADEEDMLSVTKSAEIEAYIKKLEADGRLKAFGRYSNMPNEDCYVFVFNKEGGISAYLLKHGTGYLNLESGKPDEIKAYKGCGARWFQIKK